MSPPRKSALRRAACRDKVRKILSAIAKGEVETYVGFRQLYGWWIGNNAAVQELRPLFRIPGIEADGAFSVTPQSKETVVKLAIEILPHFEKSYRRLRT